MSEPLYPLPPICLLPSGTVLKRCEKCDALARVQDLCEPDEDMGDCSIFMIQATENMLAADPELAKSFAEMVIVTEEIIASRSQAKDDARPRLVPVDYDPFVEVPYADAVSAEMREIETRTINDIMRNELRESLIRTPLADIGAMMKFLNDTKPTNESRPMDRKFVSSPAAKSFSLVCFRAAYYHRNYSGDWAERIRAAIHDLKIAIAEAENNREIFPNN